MMFMAFLSQQEQENKLMSPDPLTIAVECKGNPGCVFFGDDIFLRIIITNTSTKPIGFPLEYLKRTGPYVTLIDYQTDKKQRLRFSLAPRHLLTKFTTIPPHGSIEMTDILAAGAIRTFRSELVNIKVELKISNEILVDNMETIRFVGVNIFDIIKRDMAENKDGE
jgi:hypothetical protein